ncbi:threonine aldolase family protein [Desulfovibrio litoralis]|uniref:L-threonine aldolase n=1 Tax=Desulfovibrio litoralis DSM 11393 TaxID=1121455 RepID=A0A1M7S0M9_9BACT|nr:low specificity L-threonine aldolase [Desulfovibrio litoralis]SHN51894.1 L-threonine aldolase [Desulfovibrio litoralis DSM 11393]
MKNFASDNTSGVHPQIFEALQKANISNVPAYGDDEYSQLAAKVIKQHFGEHVVPYFVLLGTAANVLSLGSVTPSWGAVICADTAHINSDECGAPEAKMGCKLFTVPNVNGKITPEACLPTIQAAKDNVHHSQPKVISITQSTELGTVYTPNEIKALADFAHANGLYLHVDGARLSNAAVTLNLPFKAFTTDLGVDLLSLGGTKNGLMFGEAVVFLNPALAENFIYMRKQSMQLLSKMRFVATQFIEYLEADLWKTNATNANIMAKRLADGIKDVSAVKICYPVQANALFVRIETKLLERLAKEYYFYVLDPNDHKDYPKGYQLVRWMTSFNTTTEQVDDFIQAIRK